MQDPNETADAAVKVDDSFDSNFDSAPPEVVEPPLDSQASDLLSSDLPSEVVPPDGEDLDGVEVVVMPSGCDATNAPSSDAECPVPGAPCNDGNPCTSEDQYSTEGICTGQLDSCSDDEPCTQDNCWDNVGCTHVWTPGCGGKPCGDCPVSHGFQCLSNQIGFTCRNETTNEVYVAAGIFWFGWNGKATNSPTGVPAEVLEVIDQAYEYRVASNPAFIDGFAIDATRVTQADLKLAAELGVLGPPGGVCEEYLAQSPGDNEEWVANAYFYCFDAVCQLQGKRLCTEFEWEKAATGGAAILGVDESDWDLLVSKSRLWPWGDQVGTCDQISLCDDCSTDGIPSCEIEVLQHPNGVSVYGAHDMFARNPEHVLSSVQSGDVFAQKGIYDGMAGVDQVIPGSYSVGGYWTSDSEDAGLLTTKGYIFFPSFWFYRQIFPYPAVAAARCCRGIE